jgi:hypothetical protein
MPEYVFRSPMAQFIYGFLRPSQLGSDPWALQELGSVSRGYVEQFLEAMDDMAWNSGVLNAQARTALDNALREFGRAFDAYTGGRLRDTVPQQAKADLAKDVFLKAAALTRLLEEPARALGTDPRAATLRDGQILALKITQAAAVDCEARARGEQPGEVLLAHIEANIEPSSADFVPAAPNPNAPRSDIVIGARPPLPSRSSIRPGPTPTFRGPLTIGRRDDPLPVVETDPEPEPERDPAREHFERGR